MTENEQQSQETSNSLSQEDLKSSTSTNEYVNPRGIRFTASTSTVTNSAPTKGKSISAYFSLGFQFFLLYISF